jgi:hypothetical protein
MLGVLLRHESCRRVSLENNDDNLIELIQPNDEEPLGDAVSNPYLLIKVPSSSVSNSFLVTFSELRITL